MRRFLLSLLMLLALLAVSVPCFALPGCVAEAGIPQWALDIRDATYAENMGVYTHNALLEVSGHEPKEFLHKALGDYSREVGEADRLIYWHIIAWRNAGATTPEVLGKLQQQYRQALSRYYLRFLSTGCN